MINSLENVRIKVYVIIIIIIIICGIYVPPSQHYSCSKALYSIIIPDSDLFQSGTHLNSRGSMQTNKQTNKQTTIILQIELAVSGYPCGQGGGGGGVLVSVGCLELKAIPVYSLYTMKTNLGILIIYSSV